jgi:hypothetical protein
MKTYLFLGLLLFLPVTALQSAEELSQDKNGNFILYLSNQSFAVNPVDIKVFIDDIIAVEQEFDVKGARGPQHNWIQFQFSLAPGKHTIRALSSKGRAKLEKEFEIKKKNQWAVINYWYYPEVIGGSGPTPRSFDFMVKEEPILFE